MPVLDASYLKHSSLLELDRHSNLLDGRQKDYLSVIARKMDYKPIRWRRDGQNYAQNAGIMLMSDSDHRQNFAYCGINGDRCKLWKICPFCNWEAKREMLRRFVTAYSVGTWWFLTVSWKTSVQFDLYNHTDLIHRWDAARYAVRRMVEERFFHGAIIREEFAIHSIYPVLDALPHLHVLVQADEVTKEMLELLRRLMAEYLGEMKIPQNKRTLDDGWSWADKRHRWAVPDRPVIISAVPDTKTYCIPTQGDLARVISYIMKPMDLSVTYDRAWAECCAVSREMAPKINEAMNEMIWSWEMAMIDRKQVLYVGSLHYRSTAFPGVEVKERESQSFQQVLSILLREMTLECVLHPPERGIPVEAQDLETDDDKVEDGF